MSRIVKAALILSVALSTIGRAARVAEGSVPDWVHPVHPEREIDKIAAKNWRGLVNVLTGWGEVPRQIARSYAIDGPWLFVPLGITKGLTMTLVRTGIGAFEFILPFDVVTGDYDPILLPPFVWQYYAHEQQPTKPEAGPPAEAEPEVEAHVAPPAAE